jgi:hypothetical protein
MTQYYANLSKNKVTTMKNTSLILIIISLTLFNSTTTQEQWVKDQNGCNLWGDKKTLLPSQSI